MRVWALWHGGASYAAPYVSEDVETFASISEAREAFTDRYSSGHGFFQTFNYVNREQDHALTPAVSDDCTMTLWLYDPTEDTDPYPWKILSIGARGGVRLDHA